MFTFSISSIENDPCFVFDFLFSNFFIHPIFLFHWSARTTIKFEYNTSVALLQKTHNFSSLILLFYFSNGKEIRTRIDLKLSITMCTNCLHLFYTLSVSRFSFSVKLCRLKIPFYVFRTFQCDYMFLFLFFLTHSSPVRMYEIKSTIIGLFVSMLSVDWEKKYIYFLSESQREIHWKFCRLNVQLFNDWTRQNRKSLNHFVRSR